MKARITKILTTCLLSLSVLAYGQETDSTVLEFDTFYGYVINNHPVVKQANLLTLDAQQQLRMARGAFDPKLAGNWDLKEFKDTEYWNNAGISLQIPTWFPVNPKVGIDRNRGNFLNPENFIPDNTNNQQVYGGVAIPIGRGLIIDDRRATVKKAQLFQGMAETEQIIEINKILLQAAKDYWSWYAAFNGYILMQQSISLAQEIYDNTKLGFQYGEVAAVDTLQARIVLQSRRVQLEQANLARIQAALRLSNHLWNAEGAPLELADNVIPQEPDLSILSNAVLLDLVKKAELNHPKIVQLGLKNQSLQVDRSLAKENLKPQLDLEYYLLDQPIAAGGESQPFSLQNNYKMGVSFAFPVFLRKERAKIGRINLKIRENELKRDYSIRKITNDVHAEYNAVQTLSNVINQQREMVTSYQLILNAEQLNLQNGESDLFKINIQFEKLIEAQNKLLKLRAEYQKGVAKLYWAAGISNLNLLNN